MKNLVVLFGDDIENYNCEFTELQDDVLFMYTDESKYKYRGINPKYELFMKYNYNCFDSSYGSYELLYKRYQNQLINVIKNYDNIIVICSLRFNLTLVGVLFISKLGRDINKNNYIICSKPFSFEGKQKFLISNKILDKIKDYAIVIEINNQKYLKYRRDKEIKDGVGEIGFDDEVKAMILSYKHLLKQISVGNKIDNKSFSNYIDNKMLAFIENN